MGKGQRSEATKHEESVQEESSSDFGRKRSPADDESIQRADAETNNAWKRAAKRASATCAQELENFLGPATGTSSTTSLIAAAETGLAESRGTLETITVSELQQTHVVIFCHLQKKSRKKQLHLLGSLRDFMEVFFDVTSETRVHVRTVNGND